jgi:hypothetical protein
MIYSVVAVLLFLLILVRCALVVNAMTFKGRGRSWLAWEAYTGAYCLLVFSAGLSMVHVCVEKATCGDWSWLLASAGLIVFDRRVRRADCVAKSESIS